jgi:N-acetylmuramoyl-L-alanine amidase
MHENALPENDIERTCKEEVYHMRRYALLTICCVLGIGFTAVCANPSQAAAVKPYPFLVNPFLTNVDVLLDIGHGGIDSGTLHGNLHEKDINLEIGKITYKLLQDKGLRVLMNRMDDYSLSEENQWYKIRSRHLKDLAQRSHLANEIHPKAVISLHVNWASQDRAHGPVVLYQKTESSMQLAQCLQQSLNQLYRTESAPVYGKTYFLLKHIEVPTVIVEMGFISNRLDREQMTKPQKQQQLAQSIASGVLTYLKNSASLLDMHAL